MVNTLKMDTDISKMTKDQLVAEIKKLRNAIRQHRDCSGHDLCWFHPDLWNVLPEHRNVKIEVPEWSSFMEGCVRYRKSLDEQLPSASRTSEKFK